VSLRAIHIASRSDALSCVFEALPPRHITQLTVPLITDLWSSYGSIKRDFRGLRHLTILASDLPLHVALVGALPSLTHLRMSLNTDPIIPGTLARLKCLTHLWFTPCTHDLVDVWDMARFLRELRETCRTLERVRLDVDLKRPPAGFEHVEQNLDEFPFVSVHRHEESDPSWREMDMWTDTKLDGDYWGEACENEDSEDEDQTDGEATPKFSYNIYAKRFKEYFSVRRSGGGWDD